MSSKQKQEVLNNIVTLLCSSNSTVLQHCRYLLHCSLSPRYGAGLFWHALVSPHSFSLPFNLITFSDLVYHLLFALSPPSVFLSAAPPDFPLHFSPYMSVCISAYGLVFIAGKKKKKRHRCCSRRIICTILPEGGYKTP